MKKSKNKIIMIVLTATIISNTMVPISTLAESNTILNNTNYATESQGKEEVIYINLDGTSDEIVSFTSEKNTNVQSVQFVIKTPEIKKATIEVLKDEEKSPTLWERIINLFK